MRAYFDSVERISALVRAADEWRGTPWRANGNMRGAQGGVSCQKLCSELYAAAGWKRIEVPEVPMAHARFASKSLLEPWMDGRAEFVRVWERPMAGDLVGFVIGRVLHHCGIALQDGFFVHAMDGIGTGVSSLQDATWLSRLGGTWRPLDL